MSVTQIVKHYTTCLLVLVCAETPFGNVDSCFAYFKDLVLCHAVNVSVSCLLCHAAGTVPVSLSVSHIWFQFPCCVCCRSRHAACWLRMYEESLPLVPSLLLLQIGSGNVFILVFLFVSAQDNSSGYEWIFMQFGENWPEKSWLNFGSDPKHILDIELCTVCVKTTPLGMQASIFGACFKTRINCEGCSRKGIWRKNGGMEMGRWLVQMEWHPARLSMCLPLLSALAP